MIHRQSGELIVLGSGTSNGVPTLGVKYPPEFLANSKNHRTRSSVVVQGPGGNFLVDCSPEMRLQLLREEVGSVEAVLITHSHADHILGMDDLRSFCLSQSIEMPVYTLPRYQDDIRRIFPYAFQEFPEGVFVPRFDLRDLPERAEIVGLDFEFFLVKHGKIPVIGFRVNDVAYITDVSEIPDEVVPKLQNLRVLIVDAVRFAPHPNHFNFEEAMKTIEEFSPQSAILTHLSHDYDHDLFEETLPSNVRLAFDGLRILL